MTAGVYRVWGLPSVSVFTTCQVPCMDDLTEFLQKHDAVVIINSFILQMSKPRLREDNHLPSGHMVRK